MKDSIRKPVLQLDDASGPSPSTGVSVDNQNIRGTGAKMTDAVLKPLQLGLALRRRLGRWRRLHGVRRWQDYQRAMTGETAVCSYIGWVGHGNVGDDALYEAFRDVLFPKLLMTLEDDVSALSWVARRRQEVAPTLLGGGTLINVMPYYDALVRAHSKGAPFAVFGTGVSDSTFWSRFPEHKLRGGAALWPDLLREARYIGVRGPRSAESLDRQGIRNVEIIGDPALSLPKLPRRRNSEKFVLGLNLGSHDPVDGGAPAVFDAALDLARHVLKQGAEIMYVCLHAIDAELGKRLYFALGKPDRFRLLPCNGDVSRVCSQLARCDLVVGQRLHATVLACAQGVANLSLSYQPKCFDFLESIGQSKLAIDTVGVSGGALIERYDWLLAHQDSVEAEIAVACDRFRRLQSTRAREVQSMLFDEHDQQG